MSGTRRRWQRDEAKERLWREMVERWQKSGATIRAFCATQRLSEPSFHAWRRELQRRDQEEVKPRKRRARRAAFVPVRVIAQEPTAVLEIVLSAGRVLRVPPGFDRQTLTEVLAVLEGRPC